MTVELRARVMEEFAHCFGGAPEFLARAPGRVNLIGDHTDYNEGFVLPMAIDRSVWIAFRRRPDDQLCLHSLDFDQEAWVDLTGEFAHVRGWREYVHGIVWALQQDSAVVRPLSGWEGVVVGDVPLGAGLSSSAALELALARAFIGASRGDWDPVSMARLAQRAENAWVGVNCGIMDQLISSAGEEGRALLIDCRSLETRAVAIPRGASVVILDTATRRGLVDSAYNERRQRCEDAARYFGVRALRDVSAADLRARETSMDPVTVKRARHVIAENARTLAAAEALERGDLQHVGRLMDESHVSLRDDFEVSRAELDTMVEIARAHDACYGARMTGAGFGGCAVALVQREAAMHFADEVATRYRSATKLTPSVYICAAAAGASLERL